MLCCPRSVSLCRMQLPEARFDLPLRRGLGTEGQSWLRGHGCGLGAEGLRAPNPASPRMRTPVECDLGARNPQQSSRAQGSRGSPAQLRPMESAGPGGENGLHCFPEPRRVGGVVCCPRRVSLCRMQLPEAPLGPSVRGGLTLNGRAGSGGMAGTRAQTAFALPILLAHEGEPVWSVIRVQETPSKAAGPRDPGVAQLSCALWRAEGQCRKRIAGLS